MKASPSQPLQEKPGMIWSGEAKNKLEKHARLLFFRFEDIILWIVNEGG